MNRKKVKKAVRNFIKSQGIRYGRIMDFNEGLQFMHLTGYINQYVLNKKLRSLGCYCDKLGDSICIFKREK